jgi:hypothetical protein
MGLSRGNTLLTGFVRPQGSAASAAHEAVEVFFGRAAQFASQEQLAGYQSQGFRSLNGAFVADAHAMNHALSIVQEK